MENIFAKRRARLLAMKAMRENYVPGERLCTCPQCGGESERRAVAAALSVCPLCGYHFPMGAYYRLSSVLDSETFHSLRSSLGVRMSTNERQLGEHATWKAHASAAWNHELLDKAGTMHASFVEAANAGFSNTVKVPGRDSLGLGAGVRFNTDKHVSFSLNAGSELFRRDATSVYGNLAVEWKF